MTPSARAQLVDLLMSMFSPEEFRRFLRSGPDGSRLDRDLPVAASHLTLVVAAVDALERRGMIDAGFFGRLRDERSRRAPDIARVAAGFAAGEPEPRRARPTWDVFVSYSGPDRPAAEALYRALAQRGRRVFFDAANIRLGDSVASALSDALNNSRVVVVLVSSASISSAWVRREIDHALASAVGGDLRVVPVWLDRSAMGAESLPFFLRSIHGVDAEALGMDAVGDQVAGLLDHMDQRAG